MIIVRNFHMVKVRPRKPMRVWRKNTGRPSSMSIATMVGIEMSTATGTTKMATKTSTKCLKRK